jgi:hypothetical protein
MDYIRENEYIGMRMKVQARKMAGTRQKMSRYNEKLAGTNLKTLKYNEKCYKYFTIQAISSTP